MTVERAKVQEIEALRQASAISLEDKPEISPREVKQRLSMNLNLGADAPLIRLINRIVDQINESGEVISGNAEPDATVAAYPGQLYFESGGTPPAFWVCCGQDEFGSSWARLLTRDLVGIEKTGTSGLVDTYTISYTDGSVRTFTVTNADKDGAEAAKNAANGAAASAVAAAEEANTAASGARSAAQLAEVNAHRAEDAATEAESAAGGANTASARADRSAADADLAAVRAGDAAIGASHAKEDANAAALQASSAALAASEASSNASYAASLALDKAQDAEEAAAAANEAAACRGYITCEIVDEALYFTYHNLTGISFALNNERLEVVYSV